MSDPSPPRQARRERLRPRYHLTRDGYINDPNGFIHHGGMYHLFYQRHGEALPQDWWRKRWGHAVSADLVHWTQLEDALVPGPQAHDAHGCWSGCAVAVDGGVRLIYTGIASAAEGVFHQQLCAATALGAASDDPRLERWRKDARPHAVAGVDHRPGETFRDPFVWRAGAGWQAVIAGMHGGCESVLLLESADLVNWRCRGPLVRLDSPELEREYALYECPNLFPLAGEGGCSADVLLVSRQLAWGVYYWAGRLEDARYAHGRWRALAPNSRFYAGLTCQDANGRRLLVGYIEEGRVAGEIAAAGWCNTLSLPMALGLAADGRLLAEPASEVAALRRAVLPEASDLGLGAQPRLLPRIRGAALELICDIDPGGADQVAIDVLADPHGGERARIIWDVAHQRLWIDVARSRDDGAPTGAAANPRLSPDAWRWFCPAAAIVRLRVFVDHSLIEVFAHGHYVNQRAYPARATSDAVAVSAVGGAARLVRLSAWRLGLATDERAANAGMQDA